MAKSKNRADNDAQAYIENANDQGVDRRVQDLDGNTKLDTLDSSLDTINDSINDPLNDIRVNLLLNEIIKQLRIMNTHLESITDIEKLDEEPGDHPLV